MFSTSLSIPPNAFAGGPEPALGKERLVPPTRKQKYRKKIWRQFLAAKRQCWALLAYLRRHDPDNVHRQVLERHGSFRCRTSPAYGTMAGVSMRGNEATWSGLSCCGSAWGCPICAPVILRHHQEKISVAFDVANENDYTVVFTTLTVPHKRFFSPTDLIFLIQAARKIYGKGGTRQRLERGMGRMGDITRLEVTDGPNGLHPHYHILTFFDCDLPEEGIINYIKYLSEKWTQACREVGLVDDHNAAAFADHGFRAERVVIERADTIAKYLAKMAFSQEMTNAGDGKRGKRGGRSMWDVLAGFTRGDPSDTDKWLSYLAAFYRKPVVRWSPRLKRKLGVDILDDEQIVNTDDGAEVQRVYEVRHYQQVVHRGLWYPILRAVESKNFKMLQNISKKYAIDFIAVAEGYPDITQRDDLQRPTPHGMARAA